MHEQVFGKRLGNHHRLNTFQIVWGSAIPRYQLFTPTPMPSFSPSPIQATDQRMLEPLTEIWNVPRVSVNGARADIAYKLERAISCPQKAVSPRKEIYHTKLVKPKGQLRKQPRRFRTTKYWESQVNCLQSSLSALRSRSCVY